MMPPWDWPLLLFRFWIGFFKPRHQADILFFSPKHKGTVNDDAGNIKDLS